MIRWSLVGIVIAALLCTSCVEALPHRHLDGRLLHARNTPHEHQAVPTSSMVDVPSALESTVSEVFDKPRIGVTKEGHKVPSYGKRNETERKKLAEELHRSIQKQIEQESVNGGVELDLSSILGDMYNGRLKVEGEMDKKHNKTDVSETIPKSKSSSSRSKSHSSSSSSSSTSSTY